MRTTKMTTVILSEAKDLRICGVAPRDPSPSARLRMTLIASRSHRLPSSSHIALRGGRFEQLAGFGFVVGRRRYGEIGILEAVRIAFDAFPRRSQSSIDGEPSHQLLQSLCNIRRIEPPDGNDRQTRSPIAAELEANRARLERMNVLDSDRSF